MTPLRIALLVLYATTRTERMGRVVEGASAYTVEQLIESRLGGVGGYRKSACYENSRQLVELGYLETDVLDETSRRPTTIYTPTKKGLDAVRAWMETPTAAPRIDSEIFLRIRALPYTRPDQALASLGALRPHLTRPLAELDAEDVAPDLATPYAQLERDYFRLVLEAHLTWLARAEKRLKGMNPRSRRTKSEGRERR
jgi:DNA-binding PadR family transcriptional regulator